MIKPTKDDKGRLVTHIGKSGMGIITAVRKNGSVSVMWPRTASFTYEGWQLGNLSWVSKSITSKIQLP